MFSMLMPMKSRATIFRGEIICEDTSDVGLIFFVGLEGLSLEDGLVVTPGLDGFCFLVVGFFIEAKTGFQKS